MGRKFGDNVADALRDKASKLYRDLSKFLRKNLDDYTMETEVQLYIEGDKYMVADILLFRRSQTTNKVSDVILIENKLSSTTRFTSNQSEMFRNVQRA